MDIKQQIADLREKALAELAAVKTSSDLEAWRVRYLGKKSHLTEILRGLAALSIEERKEAGAVSNTLKIELESAFKSREEALRENEIAFGGLQRRYRHIPPRTPFPARASAPCQPGAGRDKQHIHRHGFPGAGGP